MDNNSPEPQDSKQVLEYYRLFGRDRDIRQYLTLPPIIDLSDSNKTLCEEHAFSDSSKCEKGKNVTIERSNEIEDEEETYHSDRTNDNNDNVNKELLGKSKNSSTKLKDLVFNIESQIEINYDIEIPESSCEGVRQVKFENISAKPKGILKVDELCTDPLANVEGKRNTISPTSSVASNKRLEWDSMADIGYTNSDDAKKPLSTLERIALQQGHKSQYGENEIAAEGISNEQKNVENSEVALKNTKARKFIGKPTAESTPIVYKSELSDVSVKHISNIKKSEENLIKSNDLLDIKGENNNKKKLKQHKSLNDIDFKSEQTKKIDKYIQTTLTREIKKSSLISTSNTNTEITDDDSEKVPHEKENIKMTPIKNTSKSRMIKKRMARRKIISTKQDDDLTSDNQCEQQNALDVLKGDNRFNISQSSLSSHAHTFSHVNENLNAIADSFEFMSRIHNDQDLEKMSDTTSSTKNVTKISNSKESSSSNNYLTSGASTNFSSNNNDPLFDDIKMSTLNHDIKTSIRLLNCLMSSKKGNLELKKRMVKRIVKRLLQANYGDETSTTESNIQSKSNNYTSSSTEINSRSSSPSKFATTSKSVSPDPSYSLPEHLIANVPWKPYKFAQGVDFIRVPTKPSETEVLNSLQPGKQKVRGVFTLKGNNETQVAIPSDTLQSFKDLTKDDSKSIDNINKLSENQRILAENLVHQQIQLAQNQNASTGTGLINYAKQEKNIQLAWIKSELEHLNYLKILLENETEKTKFDSLGPYKVSERGDTKFDFNFFTNLGDRPNRNIAYPLMTNAFNRTDLNRNSCPCIKMVENPKTSKVNNTQLSTNSESSKSCKSKPSQNLQEMSPSCTEKHSSASNKNESIREQIKKLTKSIEMLKQSTHLAKTQKTSGRNTQLSYQDWDSHINISQPYSEIMCIDKDRQQKNSKTKSSNNSTPKTKLSTDVDVGSKIKSKSTADSDKRNSSHSKVTESSLTHSSLKSTTISINEGNKSSELSSVGPNLDNLKKIKTKSNVQTISTQTSDLLVESSDKHVEATFVSCNHCKKCSCKCNKRTQTSSKSLFKEKKPPVAYILTFESDSMPTSSSKNGRKLSLDEVKIKLPHNRENKTKQTKLHKIKVQSQNKQNKYQDDEKFNEKTLITLYDAKSKFEASSSQELHSIKLGSLTDDSSKNNSCSRNISDKKSKNSDDTETENFSKVLSESTLLSTSTDSFLIGHKKKQNTEKKHKPTVQECLVIYKNDFVKRADRRRDVINRIAQLRLQRNAERKKLLQLIEAEPKLQSELANVQNMLPQNTKSQKIFTTKEIREMTRKKYKNLPEVTQRKKDALRNNLYKNNRYIATIFNKKLQKKVLQGKHTLSHSTNVINGLD